MKINLVFIIFLALAPPAHAGSIRIKDLVNFDGVRTNDIVGYGLVVGLNASGDSLRNTPYTEEILSNLLERLGINVVGEQFRPRNVAAVIATARLPPFGRIGGAIDVTVSAIGDAKSLRGGTLVLTPLSAADGEIYAVAQGAIIAGGVNVEGDAEQLVQGVPTSGVVPMGARIERELDFDFSSLAKIRLALRNPDFTTARKIEVEINRHFGALVAEMLDAGTVTLDVSKISAQSTAHALQVIENIKVQPAAKAVVVVDQRTGTIVMSDEVRISRVAVSKGNLTLRVSEAAHVVQPNPFASGEGIVLPRTDVNIEEEEVVGISSLSGETSLTDIISGMNALGASPQDIIDILSSINAAGALHAELVVR